MTRYFSNWSHNNGYATATTIISRCNVEMYRKKIVHSVKVDNWLKSFPIIDSIKSNVKTIFSVFNLWPATIVFRGTKYVGELFYWFKLRHIAKFELERFHGEESTQINWRRNDRVKANKTFTNVAVVLGFACIP